MTDVLIENNNCEDAINIVNSKFTIRDINIENAISDAIDIDFSNGAIIGGSFTDIGYIGGGDALDFSGSKVLLDDLLITNISDKGLSVGEKSEVKAKGLMISNLSVAIAVKDGSSLNISDSEINNVELVAIMAYTKKPTFGGGIVLANNIEITNTKNKLKSGLNSTIIIDNKLTKKEKINVEELYETVMQSGLK
jgi:hypothetical protein